jgi:benzoate-CoA ligase family protein
MVDVLGKYKKPLFSGIIIGLAVAVALLIAGDLQGVFRTVLSINLRYLALILVLAPLNYFFRYIKWSYYLKLTGLQVEPKMNRLIFVSGLAMTISPGKIGELLKCYLLKEHMGAPVSTTSSIVMAFWLYSSGTTGTPKGVVHLHHDVLHFMHPYNEHVLSITEEDIMFSASKMYFSYGRNSMEATFVSGAAVVLEPELPRPQKVAEVITRYKPTIYFSIPTSYRGVLDLLEEEEGKYDFSSLKVCISAGEALPKVIFDRWKNRFGIEIYDGIGSTDVGGIYISNMKGKVRPGSCGVLIPGFEARLVDDEGKDVADGEVGTIWIKNDGSTPFYWRKHQKSKESIIGEWFNTSDQFIRDSDGYYWFSGRADDMLKAGGIWVSPVEVENILLQHPAVLECAMVGHVDESNLEKPLAFVVLRPGHKASPELERELQEFVRSKTAHYKYPRWVKFVEELPRTASGKVQRFKLRAALRNNEIA